MPETHYSIDQLLEQVVAQNASDLHVTAGTAPILRLKGHLCRMEGYPILSPDDTRELLYRVMSTEQQKQLEIDRQIDLAHSIPGPRALPRERATTSARRSGRPSAWSRTRSRRSRSSGCPSSLHMLAEKPRGLVLVTGPTGSGKSTTLAALIDEINRTRAEHILTIEDPIEFVHRHKRCIVNQREIGTTRTAFAEALRAALRQDPDVILVGEMRDLETIGTALTAAETGHLVFGDAAHAERAVDDRPHHRRLPGRAAGPGPDADRAARSRAS